MQINVNKYKNISLPLVQAHHSSEEVTEVWRGSDLLSWGRCPWSGTGSSGAWLDLAWSPASTSRAVQDPGKVGSGLRSPPLLCQLSCRAVGTPPAGRWRASRQLLLEAAQVIDDFLQVDLQQGSLCECCWLSRGFCIQSVREDLSPGSLGRHSPNGSASQELEKACAVWQGRAGPAQRLWLRVQLPLGGT